MRHEHHAHVGHAEGASLLERLVEERLGADAGGRDAAPLEPDEVVHTARHAGSSVGEPLDSEVAVDRDLLDDVLRRGPGEEGLREPRRRAPASPSSSSIRSRNSSPRRFEMSSSATRRPSSETGRAARARACERVRRAGARTPPSADLSRYDGGVHAEARAEHRREASRLAPSGDDEDSLRRRPLPDRRLGARGKSSGVVSPWRSSPAGRTAAS